MRIPVRALVPLLATGLVVAYVAVRALDLLRTGSVVGTGLALAVAALVAVVALLLVGEVRLGTAGARLARRLAAQGVPEVPDDLARLPSGRLDRAAAAALFARRRAEVEAAPQEWQGWYLLAVAYGAAGDASAGRRALRRADALERQSRAS